MFFSLILHPNCEILFWNINYRKVKLSKEFKVGLLAVVAGTIMYLGFNFLKGSDVFSNTNQYYAYYNDVNNLTVSNSVTLNGFAVGRVSNVKIIQGAKNRVLVEFDIDDDIVIGKNTEAELTSDLFGKVTIVLNQGNIKVPLQDGDTIQGAHQIGITETLKNTTDPLKVTMLKVNNLLEGFDGTKQKLNILLDKFSLATDNANATVGENRINLVRITKNISDLTLALKDEKEGLSPLLTSANMIADSIKVLEFSKTLDNLNKTMTSLTSTIDKMNKGDGTLAKLLNDDSLYNNLNHTAESLDKLLIDFKAHPKRYVHFSLIGKKDKTKK